MHHPAPFVALMNYYLPSLFCYIYLFWASEFVVYQLAEIMCTLQNTKKMNARPSIISKPYTMKTLQIRLTLLTACDKSIFWFVSIPKKILKNWGYSCLNFEVPVHPIFILNTLTHAWLLLYKPYYLWFQLILDGKRLESSVNKMFVPYSYTQWNITQTLYLQIRQP